MEYINKTALVAEIKRRIKEHHSGYLVCLKDILSFLDTIEGKEIDLEKEINKYISDNFFGSETMGFFANRTKEEPNDQDIALCAKHFFEFGMRASNPITAADRGTAEKIIINLKRVEKDYRIDLTEQMEWLRSLTTTSLWKDAQGQDLPPIEKEVIALEECPSGSLKVVYAHRPNPNGDAKIYDRGGWNIPNLKYWLDYPLPE